MVDMAYQPLLLPEAQGRSAPGARRNHVAGSLEMLSGTAAPRPRNMEEREDRDSTTTAGDGDGSASSRTSRSSRSSSSRKSSSARKKSREKKERQGRGSNPHINSSSSSSSSNSSSSSSQFMDRAELQVFTETKEEVGGDEGRGDEAWRDQAENGGGGGLTKLSAVDPRAASAVSRAERTWMRSSKRSSRSSSTTYGAVDLEIIPEEVEVIMFTERREDRDEFRITQSLGCPTCVLS